MFFYGRCNEQCSPQISGTRRPRPPGSSSTAESECGTSSHGRSSGWVLPNPLGTASSSLPRRRAEEQKGFEEINIKQNQTFTNWHKPHPYPVSNTTYAFICKTFFIADASQHRNEMSSWTWTKAFKKKKFSVFSFHTLSCWHRSDGYVITIANVDKHCLDEWIRFHNLQNDSADSQSQIWTRADLKNKLDLYAMWATLRYMIKIPKDKSHNDKSRESHKFDGENVCETTWCPFYLLQDSDGDDRQDQ